MKEWKQTKCFSTNALAIKHCIKYLNCQLVIDKTSKLTGPFFYNM